MSKHMRLFPLESADGATNMAADEVLLEAAASGEAGLRFYTWREPTLSLGYFQPVAERLGDPRLANLPFVRRASGGAALVHDMELTYCLALPAGSPWQRRGESWVCRMHAAITAALAEFGVAVRSSEYGEERKIGPVLCFLHHTPGDLILNGQKVAGSAQRKQRRALMQHGGVLLGQSPHAPSLPGIRELAGVEVSAANLGGAITRILERETGWELIVGEWTATERARIRELTKEKYRTEAWNRKR